FMHRTLLLPAWYARRAERLWKSSSIPAECDVWHPEIPSKPAKRQIVGARVIPLRMEPPRHRPARTPVVTVLLECYRYSCLKRSLGIRGTQSIRESSSAANESA